MTQAQAGAQEWSDERIDKVALDALGDYGTMTFFSAKKIMRQVRDDMATTIATQAAQLAQVQADNERLQAELALAQEQLKNMENRVKQWRAWGRWLVE